MESVFAEIFYSQYFKIALVIVMGVGGYLYFEEYKTLRFRAKYALFCGFAFALIGVMASIPERSIDNTIDFVLLKGRPTFSVYKFIFIGYSFIIYGLLAMLKEKMWNQNKEHTL